MQSIGEDYVIYDEREEKTPVALHDAARPFVVLHLYTTQDYRRSGRLRRSVVGRYATRKAAMSAIYRHRKRA